jgi:hypothetical protein
MISPNCGLLVKSPIIDLCFELSNLVWENLYSLFFYLFVIVVTKSLSAIGVNCPNLLSLYVIDCFQFIPIEVTVPSLFTHLEEVEITLYHSSVHSAGPTTCGHTLCVKTFKQWVKQMY